MKSGLDAESQFAELQASYFDRFAPSTPEARFQVDNLVRNEWLLRRYHRVEAQLWEYQTSLCDRKSGVQLGEAFAKSSTIFMRLQRRVNAAEKAYKEAMAELTRLQEASQPPETKDKISQLASFLNSGSEALDDFALTQMEHALRQAASPDPAPATL